MILDFFQEVLPWRSCKDNKMDEVRDLKIKCLADPETLLWKTTTNGVQEIKNVFAYIKCLGYSDRPDYEYIRKELLSILEREESKEHSSLTKTSV